MATTNTRQAEECLIEVRDIQEIQLAVEGWWGIGAGKNIDDVASDSNRHILRRALRFSTSPQKPRRPGKQFLSSSNYFQPVDPSKAGHKTIWALILNCEAPSVRIISLRVNHVWKYTFLFSGGTWQLELTSNDYQMQDEAVHSIY